MPCAEGPPAPFADRSRVPAGEVLRRGRARDLEDPHEFVHAHSRRIVEVMTTKVIVATEDAGQALGRLSRSSVLRLAIVRGLDVLESEHEPGAKPKRAGKG